MSEDAKNRNGPQGRKGDRPPVATRPLGRMSEELLKQIK
jgi:hypothetical protein